ncbi:MAG TPA: YceI family protein [Ferruginibacter sp.]|nr:YceI family protein [Ferruginibacter sp.]HMP20579.1 YceI family protein [Ferruginibacter sp.]
MATINWVVDPTHSEIGFKVKHLMFTNVSGKFKNFSITAQSADEAFDTPQISFTAETGSVDTGNEQRDGHLKSPDFFDAEKFPEISFTSTAYNKLDDDGNYELTGNLTIMGTTKPVKLAVEFGGLAKDPWGNVKAGFTITGKINRKDWGLNWNAALETGGVLVSDDVRINAEVQLVKS